MLVGHVSLGPPGLLHNSGGRRSDGSDDLGGAEPVSVQGATSGTADASILDLVERVEGLELDLEEGDGERFVLMELIEGRGEDDSEIVDERGGGVLNSDIGEGIGPVGSNSVDGALVVRLVARVDRDALPELLSVDGDASVLVIPGTKEEEAEGDVSLSEAGRPGVTVDEVLFPGEGARAEEEVLRSTRADALADGGGRSSGDVEVEVGGLAGDDLPVGESILRLVVGEVEVSNDPVVPGRVDGDDLPADQGKTLVGSILVGVTAPVKLDSSGGRKELGGFDGVGEGGVGDAEAVGGAEVARVDLPSSLETFVLLLVSPDSVSFRRGGSRDDLVGVEVQPGVLPVPGVGEVGGEENTELDEVLVVEQVQTEAAAGTQVVVEGRVSTGDPGPQEETVSAVGAGKGEGGSGVLQNGDAGLGGRGVELADDGGGGGDGEEVNAEAVDTPGLVGGSLVEVGLPSQSELGSGSINDDGYGDGLHDVIRSPRVPRNRSASGGQVVAVSVPEEAPVEPAGEGTTVVDNIHAGPLTIPRVDEPHVEVHDGLLEGTSSLGAVVDQVVPGDTSEEPGTSALPRLRDGGENAGPVEEGELLVVGRRGYAEHHFGGDGVDPQTKFTQVERLIGTGLIEGGTPLEVDGGDGGHHTGLVVPDPSLDGLVSPSVAGAQRSTRPVQVELHSPELGGSDASVGRVEHAHEGGLAIPGPPEPELEEDDGAVVGRDGRSVSQLPTSTHDVGASDEVVRSTESVRGRNGPVTLADGGGGPCARSGGQLLPPNSSLRHCGGEVGTTEVDEPGGRQDGGLELTDTDGSGSGEGPAEGDLVDGEVEVGDHRSNGQRTDGQEVASRLADASSGGPPDGDPDAVGVLNLEGSNIGSGPSTLEVEGEVELEAVEGGGGFGEFVVFQNLSGLDYVNSAHDEVGRRGSGTSLDGRDDPAAAVSRAVAPVLTLEVSGKVAGVSLAVTLDGSEEQLKGGKTPGRVSSSAVEVGSEFEVDVGQGLLEVEDGVSDVVCSVTGYASAGASSGRPKVSIGRRGELVPETVFLSALLVDEGNVGLLSGPVVESPVAEGKADGPEIAKSGPLENQLSVGGELGGSSQNRTSHTGLDNGVGPQGSAVKSKRPILGGVDGGEILSPADLVERIHEDVATDGVTSEHRGGIAHPLCDGLETDGTTIVEVAACLNSVGDVGGHDRSVSTGGDKDGTAGDGVRVGVLKHDRATNDGVVSPQLQFVIEKRRLVGDEVSPLSGETSDEGHGTSGVGGTEDRAGGGTLRTGSLNHELGYLPGSESFQGTTDIVGDSNTEGASSIVSGGIEIDVTDKLDLIDGASSPESGDQSTRNVRRGNISDATVSGVPSEPSDTAAGKGTRGGVGTGSDGRGGTGVSSVSALVNGGTSVSVSAEARETLATSTKSGVADTGGVVSARNLVGTLLEAILNHASTLGAHDETLSGRLAKDTSGVKSATPLNGITTNNLIPVQVGVATPPLEEDTSKSESVVANTTKAVQIAESHNGRGNTGIDPLPVGIDDSSMRTTLSNERKTLIEALSRSKALGSG